MPPRLHPDEIRSSIELQIEEQIPLPAEQVVFDYTVVDVDKKTGALTINIFALPIDVVSSYLEIIEDAGLYPVIFETEAQSLARAVIPYDSKKTYMIVDFGNTRSIFTIVSGHTAMFNATVDFGGRDITEAIRKQLGVTLEEAEKLKLENGITRDTSDEIFSSAIYPALLQL